MSKRKANIRPELVGELFLKPGEDTPYRLLRCDTEPLAIMANVSDTRKAEEKPISYFKDFVQLKPIYPIVKPTEPRKPRSDKGIPRERKPKVEQITTSSAETLPEPVSLTKGKGTRRATTKTEDTPEIADKKGEHLTIHVPTGLGKDIKYSVNIAGSETTSLTLRPAILAALEAFEGKIPECLTEQEKALIQGILDAGED